MKTTGVAPVIQPWCNVTTAAVRFGSMGSPIGYLWTDDGVRFHFSYLPTYCANSDALPVDPFNLPLGYGIWSARGLTGPLKIFGKCLGGVYADRVAYPTFASLVLDRELTEKECELYAPRNDLTRLVWSSFSRMTPYGVNGLWFDPSVPWPTDAGQRMWLPERDNYPSQINFWRNRRRVKVEIKPANAQSIAKVQSMGYSMVGGALSLEKHTVETFKLVVPLPGKSLRIRCDPRDSRGETHYGMVRFAEPVNGIRHVRIQAAYLQLARNCGISVVDSHLVSQGSGGRDILWTKFLPKGAWVPYDTPPPHWDMPWRDNPELNADRLLRENLERGIYLGRVPWQGYVHLARKMMAMNANFDYLEAYRRVVFAILCGTLVMDATAILFRARRNPAWEGTFVGEPICYELAPLQALKPWMLPYKTKVAMRPRLVRHAARYARLMGLTGKQAEHEVTRVLVGLLGYEKVFQSFGLNPYEQDSAQPCVMVKKPESGHATQMPRSLRKSDLKVETADLL